MTNQGLPRLRWQIELAFVAALATTLACDFGIPQSPTATPAGEVTAPPDTGPSVTEPPSSGPAKAAPGTIILDQTTAISQGSRVEMTFDAVAEQVVSIDVGLISGKPRYDFHLADKFGNFIASFPSDPDNVTEKIPEFTLPYEGQYKVLLISTQGDGSLEVVVTAGDKSSGGGKISAVGKSLAGLASSPRVYHTYFLSLTQGDAVTISALANVAGTPDTSLVLYGPDGQYVTDADDVNAPTDLNAVIDGFTTSVTGSYVAIVTNKGSAIGAYTLQVDEATTPPEAQGAPTVVYDTDYLLGLVDASNASFTFDGSVGDVLRVKVTGLTPDVSVDIYLSSPFRQTIAFAVTSDKGNDAIINETQLPYTGRYTVEVRPSGDGQGTFRIDKLSSADLTGGGVFGANPTESLPGRINQANVFHFYQFTAKAGERVNLAVFAVSRSGKLDMGFALLGPNGKQLVFADDSDSEAPQDPELTDFVIQQNGTYTVIVYTFTSATGTYDLEIQRN